MKRESFAEAAEACRAEAASRLDPKKRAALGQYMTPMPIGRFMAGLFENLSGDLRILDPGAGVGSLTAALAERLCGSASKPRSAQFVCYEIEPLLAGKYLRRVLAETRRNCARAQIETRVRICEDDFILSHKPASRRDIFDPADDESGAFTHVIMNPPYKKIAASSAHRAALRRAGLEASNLYAGFLFLAARRLADGGELAAIVPRSFCNGPYFQPFREKFFAMMTLKHLHVFEKRDSAFGDDGVLQENIILHAVKGARPSRVAITASHGGEFRPSNGRGAFEDAGMTRRVAPYGDVFRAGDRGLFVHIVADEEGREVADRMARFTATLADIGVVVSTGPVVDFRLKDDLRAEFDDDCAPLLYAAHFSGGELAWPRRMKKPNAIMISPESCKWLWRNKGCFVVTRRFSSKEERRRIVASLYPGGLPGAFVGFENHLNVFHIKRAGMPRALARGLRMYLNSGLVDRYFRQFNGHTQVNATDLRALHYPQRGVLERMGRAAGDAALSPEDIDDILEHNRTWEKTPPRAALNGKSATL